MQPALFSLLQAAAERRCVPNHLYPSQIKTAVAKKKKAASYSLTRTIQNMKNRQKKCNVNKLADLHAPPHADVDW